MSHKRVRLSALLLCILFSAAAQAQEGLQPGSRAPDFSLPTAEGSQTVTLQQYAGKTVVILHFWKSR